MPGRICRFKNGIKIPIPQWSFLVENYFYQLLPSVRAKFLWDAQDKFKFQGEIECGMRFNDNDHILSILKSNVMPTEFLGDKEEMIYDALQAAAEADWWYQHEKDWGDQERREQNRQIFGRDEI